MEKNYYFLQVNNLVAIDANPHACKLTQKNAKILKLDDRLHILNANLKKDGTMQTKGSNNLAVSKISNNKFDVIVSNPPYIPTKTLFKLQPEIIVLVVEKNFHI